MLSARLTPNCPGILTSEFRGKLALLPPPRRGDRLARLSSEESVGCAGRGGGVDDRDDAGAVWCWS